MGLRGDGGNTGDRGAHVPSRFSPISLAPSPDPAKPCLQRSKSVCSQGEGVPPSHDGAHGSGGRGYLIGTSSHNAAPVLW